MSDESQLLMAHANETKSQLYLTACTICTHLLRRGWLGRSFHPSATGHKSKIMAVRIGFGSFVIVADHGDRRDRKGAVILRYMPRLRGN